MFGGELVDGRARFPSAAAARRPGTAAAAASPVVRSELRVDRRIDDGGRRCLSGLLGLGRRPGSRVGEEADNRQHQHDADGEQRRRRAAGWDGGGAPAAA